MTSQSEQQSAPDATVAIDQTGRIVIANRLAERMFGYPPDALVGRTIEQLVPEYFHEAVDGGSAFSARRHDGSSFVVEIRRSALATENGPLVVNILRDPAQKRRAEATYRGLLEAAPDGLVVVDASGNMVIVNSQSERMFGYPREELIGNSIELLVPQRYRGIHAVHRGAFGVAPKLRPMGSTEVPLIACRRDGTEFPVEISLSPVQTEGEILIIAVVRDITARKRVETQLRNSLKEKEILLKEIHHRVKNNLQIVSSMLSLQIDQITDARALAAFKDSASRVRSIALFHEKLYQSEDLANVNLGEYLRGVAHSLFATYGVLAEHVELSVDATEITLEVDAAISCGLIVNELVSNCLKHAFPRGRGGAIRITLRHDGGRAVLEVQDSGIGFPTDVDFRSPSTLGLRLVGILTEQLQGTITLDRAAGTRFTIAFERGAAA